MSGQPFRFLHAGDFHLESPAGGVTDVPSHLRELFLEAPYLAAERVFEAALAEEVDFLVLSGNLLHPNHTGPRGPLFLVEQFGRLRERGIAVYWAGGEIDPPELWPDAISLPDNVTLFARGVVEQVIHRRDELPLARIVGRSAEGRKKIRGADFAVDDDGLFTVAICHGTADPARLADTHVNYWALGGRHARRTLAAAEQMVHYAGSPQGRRPTQTGPHGCSLVQTDTRGRCQCIFTPTDVLRWQHEHVHVEPTTTREDLQTILRERLQAAIQNAAGTDLLVAWTVSGIGPLVTRLRRSLSAELLDGIRKEFGHRSPVAWSVTLDAEWADPLPADWYEQETLLGDFLREVRRFQSDERLALDLQPYLGEREAAGTWNAMADLTDPDLKRTVLDEVRALGIDLLSGEGTTP